MSQQEDKLNVGAQDTTRADSNADQSDAASVGEKMATERSGADSEMIGQDSLATLQGELEQALAKAEENWKLYLSARAEMENIRKRAERDLQNAHKFALKDFVDALLPVKDSLEMGIAAAGGEGLDPGRLREGSELILKMLASVLEKFGVQELNPVGTKFNPDLHQAMAMQPSEEFEPNTVLQVAQKGYMLNERLIRPAMVIVAQAAKKAESGIENAHYDPKINA